MSRTLVLVYSPIHLKIRFLNNIIYFQYLYPARKVKIKHYPLKKNVYLSSLMLNIIGLLIIFNITLINKHKVD